MNSTQYAHPIDELVPDPAGQRPACDEAEFAELLGEMVAENAPRRFAVVQEYGERVDAVIAAWGMAFADHAVVAPEGNGPMLSLRSAGNAVPHFNRGSHIHARLVWLDPPAAPAEVDRA